MEKSKQTYTLPDGWIEVEIKDISLKINYGYTTKSISNNTGQKKNGTSKCQRTFTILFCEIFN